MLTMTEMPEMSYSKSGVSIKKEEFAIKGLKKWLEKSFKFREGKVGEVVQEIGGFANLVDMGYFLLAVTTDGVGSKVLVAQELEVYDKIGIDLVAMLVNDLICVSAEPIAMVDYLALERVEPEMVKEISRGIYEGARKANIAVIGGETATLPDIIRGVKNRGFDLAGAAVGVVKKEDVVNSKENIKVGNIVLGLKSSGIHSNGLTLARKVLPKDLWLKLLTPTEIYSEKILELSKKFEINGLVNITGGGFRNLERVTEYGFLLDKLPEPQMIFKEIQKRGNVPDEEMYKTFNMGVGFCVIADEKNANLILKNYGEKFEMMEIGKVTEEKKGGVRIVKSKKEIKLV